MHLGRPRTGRTPISRSWRGNSFEEAGVSVLVLCGPRRTRVGLPDRCDGRSSQRGQPGWSPARDRADQSLRSTIGALDHDRFRASSFRGSFNTPVITLFGPTHIAWTRTYHSQGWHVFHPVPCGPCQRPDCPEGHHRCMRDLTPESVLKVALRILNNDPTQGANRDRETELPPTNPVGAGSVRRPS